MRFAPAASTREDAEVVVRGVPLDVTGSFHRGYARAPQRIREASRSLEPYRRSADVDLTDVPIHDAGDVDVWPDPEEVVAFAAGLVEDDVAAGATPVLLGGEHTVSLAGVRAVEPDVFVSIDAHLDLKRRYEDRRYHHACVTARVVDRGVDAVVAGARSGSRAEYDRLDEGDATAVAADDVDVATVLDAVPAEGSVYCSVDLDAIDPGFAPGVGTPEPHGLRPQTVRDCVAALAPRVEGFDVVEHVPARDAGGATAALAASLVGTFVAHADDG